MTKRNESALTKGAAVDKIASIAASAEDRYNAALAEIRSADVAKMRALLARVPAADQAAVAKMLAALNIAVPVMDAALGEAAEPDDETPSRPSTAEYEEPATKERIDLYDAVPKGATDYVPGPAAQAARGRR